ncbi:MAG: ATP phosphoribosyltransferase regulatory subunit [Pseudomonadota bacterium]|nr:ATP phosphoribosyltransferase regulatory subunit [Pseudomonadota bacterium]
MLTSSAEIIDALGGTKKVAEMLGVGASAISNYRRDGFPAAKHYALAKACEASGLAIDDRVFGGPPAAAPRHFRYDGANKPPVTSPDGFLKDLVAAGYRQVETPILQPSDPFINRMGAEMQRRLYRFTDPGGEELCLRPDLTIPSVLDYVRAGRFDEARLCYQGTAFRYQPRGAGKPEEFTQMGLEIINGKTGDAAIEDDIEVLEKLLKIIQGAGVTGYKIHFVLARARKISHPKAIIPPERLARIIPPDPDAMIAGRSGEDIIRRIERSRRYHAQRTEQQNEEDPPDDSLAMDWMETVASALDLKTNDFETFGQSGGFDYYTGVSFEIHVPELGPRKVIASGGRYDNLVESLGAPHQIPAVGGAIALERLREAAGR